MEAYRHPQNGCATLFWIEATVLYELKPEAQKSKQFVGFDCVNRLYTNTRSLKSQGWTHVSTGFQGHKEIKRAVTYYD